METHDQTNDENNEPNPEENLVPSNSDGESQFPELDNFAEAAISQAEINGQHNYHNPGTEFHTGHWAISDDSATLKVDRPLPQQSAKQDFVETIPPVEQTRTPMAVEVLPETVN